jgi:hypothetical protein
MQRSSKIPRLRYRAVAGVSRGPLAAGVVSQGLTILDWVKKGLNGDAEKPAGRHAPLRRSAPNAPNGEKPDQTGA